MSQDPHARPTPWWFHWMVLVLAVPPAITGTIAIVDRIEPTMHRVSVVLMYVLLLSATLAVVFLCMSLLQRLLRKLDRTAVALILFAFSVGIVLGGRWVPPASVATAVTTKATTRVTITYPPYNATVEGKIIARGTTNDRNGTVWVVIHPMSTDGYWVQRPVTPRQDGTWAETVCFGSSDRFELMAVANPLGVMRPGLVLGNWPEAEAKSPVVEVIR